MVVEMAAPEGPREASRRVGAKALLRALLDGGVELIVVGGVAAILHGAPTTTRDLDIVHRPESERTVRAEPNGAFATGG
jgi:hypothetical protein